MDMIPRGLIILALAVAIMVLVVAFLEHTG